jgi:hypothetical protein
MTEFISKVTPEKKKIRELKYNFTLTEIERKIQEVGLQLYLINTNKRLFLVEKKRILEKIE